MRSQLVTSCAFGAPVALAGFLRGCGGDGLTELSVGAALSVIGALATAAVTLVSVLVKRSFDRAAENRFRMETAIRAVGLLSTADGKDAPKTQQAAALFALEELGQLEFALILLRQIWAADRITAASAVWLINRGLTSKGAKAQGLQKMAAELLLSNAKKLLDSKGELELPNCLNLKWPLELNEYTRSRILEVLLLVVLSRPWKQWDERYLNGVVFMLYLVVLRDTETRLRVESALALRTILQLPREGRGIYLPSGERRSYGSLRREVEEYLMGVDTDLCTRRVRQLVQELEGWVATAASGRSTASETAPMEGGRDS